MIEAVFKNGGIQLMCDNCIYKTECETDENFVCPADESDDMWAITQGE